MVQHAGEEVLRRLAELHRLAGGVGRRPARGVDEAHVDVHAVAHQLRIGLWREDHAMAQPMRGGARHLTRDDRMIGSGQRGLRHHRHLELARAVFGEKRVGNHARGAQRGGKGLAEAVLAAEGAEGVGVAGSLAYAGVEEFLLERRHEPQARQVVELLDGAPQEIPRTALPGAAVGIADVAQEEMLDRRPVGEIDPHFD